MQNLSFGQAHYKGSNLSIRRPPPNPIPGAMWWMLSRPALKMGHSSKARVEQVGGVSDREDAAADPPFA